MSHFSKIAIKFKNRECLVAALQIMGFEPQIQETPVHLYGYQGDRREQLAHLVVPRQQIGYDSNDLGFYWNGTEYECLISEYDQTYGNAQAGQGLGSDFLPKLRAHYVSTYTEKIAAQLGGTVTERSKAGSKTTLRITVPQAQSRISSRR